MDERFASFAQRVEKIDAAIDVNDLSSLISARSSLAEIIEELEGMHQEEESSSENGGESSVKPEVTNLLQQTKQLFEVLDLTIQKHELQKQMGSNGGGNSSGGSPFKQDQVDLAREEIAKLLLLVSRAHSIGQISAKQKSVLKGELCFRRGYLRDVLRKKDITDIMAALTSAANKVLE